MHTHTQSSRPFRKAFQIPVFRGSGFARYGAALLAIVLLGGAYAISLAQVTGDRGIAPTAPSADFEIRGIEVDVTASSAEEARQTGWRQAQREAWAKAGGPKLPDGQIAGLVSSIVIQREQLGPKRYIATLGVIFDRQRAGQYLGGRARARSSAPMLLVPVTVNAGSYTTFEVRNPWQRAWAGFNPGGSRIDYVRPSGAGGDSLLINFGQTGRRSRTWWRSTLDQYSSADILVAAVRLEHQFPGGPITGAFTARYGPDSRVLESFTMTAQEPAMLDEMLDKAVVRMDTIFEAALADGKLRPDPTLRIGGSGEVDPALQRLIEIGQAIQSREAANAEAATTGVGEASGEAGQSSTASPAPPAIDTPQQRVTVRNITVQFASPDAASFDAALTGVRAVEGVRSFGVTSTAMGGTSVMSVAYGGTAEELAAALRSRGFTVRQNGSTLAISR